MRVSEAARHLGVSPATIRKAVREGQLVATKVDDANAWPRGWRWDIDAKSVEANEGRWKGRGRYRKQWLEDNIPVHVIDLTSPVNGGGSESDAIGSDRLSHLNPHPLHLMAALGTTALLALGMWMQLKRSATTTRDSKPTGSPDGVYVVDPIGNRWFLDLEPYQ